MNTMQTANHPPDMAALCNVYAAVGELLLPPAQRDRTALQAVIEQHAKRLPAIALKLRPLLDDPAAWSESEYVSTLELSPPCPLYLGAYLFGEPSSCRGAGFSERNGYMMELKRIYEHFGLLLDDQELPDFLPVLAEFLALSVDATRQRDAWGLRRRLLEQLMLPALKPLVEQLQQYKSVYAAVIEALEAAIRIELQSLANIPAWKPPVMQRTRGRVSLPVVGQTEPDQQQAPAASRELAGSVMPRARGGDLR